ncbi:MAG: hypothetical protein ACC707_17080 [Thiohalomonadales bacterium]
MMSRRFREIVIVASMSITGLIGCAIDDGIDGSGQKPKITISGTAAKGSPIVSAAISVKSNSGARVLTTTNQSGKYTIEVNESEGPYLIRAELSGSEYLFSIATEQGTTNIHPITDLIIRNWFQVQGLNVADEFKKAKAATKLPTVAEVKAVKDAITKIISLTLKEFNLPENLDLMSAKFNADNTGFDRYLDHIQIVIVNNLITYVFTNTTLDYKIFTQIPISRDFTITDMEAPSDPKNVRAISASAKEIFVVWQPSTDNVGVVGYNVYRDATLVKTTPFSVFADSGLALEVSYCYTIEAFDSAGLTSPLSAPEACQSTNGMVDVTPPPIPTISASTIDSNSIQLAITTENIGDVFSFDIYRSSAMHANQKIATINSTSYTDFNLLAGRIYCYQALAYDAAQNRSALSTLEACASTTAGIFRY